MDQDRAEGILQNSSFEDFDIPDDWLESDHFITSFAEPTCGSGTIATNRSKEQTTGSRPLKLPDSQLQREASLLMVYLDHGFPQQFPFYHPTLQQGGRAWLLPLLTSTKPVYYASLALGALYWRKSLLGRESNSLARQLKQDEEQSLILALREFRLFMSEPMDTDDCLSALACIMQMVAYEVKTNRTGGWRAHLEAAALLLNDAVRALKTIEIPESNTQPLTPESPIKTGADTQSPDVSIIEPLQFVVGATVWSLALSNSTALHEACFAHIRLMDREDCTIKLQTIVGCKSWVMICLLEAVKLSQWAAEMRSHHTLSVRELARRAQEIEDRIERGICEDLGVAVTLEGYMDTYFRAFDSEIDEAAILCISHIFALATLTLIHITVEGLNAELAEVQDTIKRTLQSVQVVRRHNLWLVLCRLVWPLTITACAALDNDDQRNKIKELLRLATEGIVESEESAGESHCKVMEVVERVWQFRRSTVDANLNLDQLMDFLETPVLLM